MKTHSTPEQLLTRLAAHRERMAEIGVHVIQDSHYSKAEQNELTRAVEDYYREVSTYWTEEDG